MIWRQREISTRMTWVVRAQGKIASTPQPDSGKKPIPVHSVSVKWRFTGLYREIPALIQTTLVTWCGGKVRDGLARGCRVHDAS